MHSGPMHGAMRVLLLLALTAGAATAQVERAGVRGTDAEAGRPFITNFAPADYDAYERSWAFAEDERGLLYVGNGSGVLEYDGFRWRLLPMPNRSAAVSTLSMWISQTKTPGPRGHTITTSTSG